MVLQPVSLIQRVDLNSIPLCSYTGDLVFAIAMK